MKDTRPAGQIAADLNDPGATRTQALAIVTDVKGARLAELARLLHVPTRGLKAHDVRDRIVAATTGSRVTTDAILNSRTDRPIPAADPAATAAAVIRSHATLAARIRETTEALLAGEVTDPAVLADLATAAQALVAVASRAAASGAASTKAATDADRAAADRVIALRAIRDTRTASDWSPMTSVRGALWHLPRAAQDALLIGMLRDGLVHPIPVSNLKALTPADDVAALKVGDQLTHAIQAVEAR